MNRKFISLAVAVAGLMFSASSASAVFIPIGAPVVVAPTPGTPATRSPESIKAKNGTAYTVATFCPAGAAAGTCTGESLSELSGGGIVTPGTPGKPGSCTQPGIDVTLGGIKGASKPC
jgi:hypothetical protein